MQKRILPIVLIFGLISFLAICNTAFAYRGMGDNCPMYQGGSNGQGHPCFTGNLSKEQIDKLNQERDAFIKETSELRANIQSKQYELQAELVKKNTDKKKAAGLQKELSDLKAQFDQKRLEHQIRMKDINPEAGLMCGRGGGAGMMSRQGHGADHGPNM